MHTYDRLLHLLNMFLFGYSFDLTLILRNMVLRLFNFIFIKLLLSGKQGFKCIINFENAITATEM